MGLEEYGIYSLTELMRGMWVVLDRKTKRKLWEGKARGPGHAKALYLSGAGAAADMSKGDDKDVDESLPELEAMPLWDYEVSRGHVWTP